MDTASECSQCRQPLEEWEAVFCEGCAMSDRCDTKDLCVNETVSLKAAVNRLWWKHRNIAEQIEKAFVFLPTAETATMSSKDAMQLLNALGARDTDEEEREIETWMQRFFS